MTKCTNCGADSADVYCARCGEKQPGLGKEQTAIAREQDAPQRMEVDGADSHEQSLAAIGLAPAVPA